jgi:adenosylcobinamide amidohydrolase
VSSPLTLERSGRWLRARFGAPHRTLGWTIVGGGSRVAAGVSWLEVTGEELAPPVDPRRFVAERLAGEGREEEPVLVTGCSLDEHVVAGWTAGAASATCVATVGLGNALRIGDPPVAAPKVGTINLLCVASRPLDDLALLEALTIAVEARTAAVVEAGVRSRASGLVATGTGTDCVVVAAPLGERAEAYAGKHTELGAAIGGAVADAVARGVRAWRQRYGALGP